MKPSTAKTKGAATETAFVKELNEVYNLGKAASFWIIR